MEFKKQHYFFLISNAFNTLKNLILPFIFLIISALSQVKSLIYLSIILIGLILIPLFISFASWYFETYAVGCDTLFAKKGVFVRKYISIPFSKVQTVDISSTLMQRFFNVCTLQVETSGGDYGDKDFEMLISINEAESIKYLILNEPKKNTYLSEYTLTLKDIAIASITSSKMSIGLSILLGGFAFLSDHIPIKYKTIILDESSSYLNYLFSTNLLYKILFVASLIFFAAWIFSIIAMAIRYHNFTLYRDSEYIKINYGLFNKKEVSIPINRILSIKVVEGILRKPLGLCEVKITNVGYGDEYNEEAILCPLIKTARLGELFTSILPEINLNYKMEKLSKYSVKSYFFFNISAPFIIFVLLSYFLKYGYISAVLPIFFGTLGLVKHFENGLYYSDNLIYLRVRKISLYTIIIPKNRIQSVKIKSNFVSNRKNIRKLCVYSQSSFLLDVYAIRGFDKSTTDKLLLWYE